MLDFAGTFGSYVNFPTINLGNAISVCAWVYPRTQANFCGLFTNVGPNVAPSGFKMQWNSYLTQNLNLEMQAGNGSVGNDNSSVLNIISLNVWQHFGYVFDQANAQVIFFLNGVPAAMATTTTVSNIGTNKTVNVGAYTGGAYPMNAQLGYIHVFNTILDATQINNDFSNSRSRFGV